MEAPFLDRRDAGRRLAGRLRAYADRSDVLVLALPRGGVPVAAEVARALRVSLDVFVVRKLGVPGHEELAMGAIASGGTLVLNADVVDALGVSDEAIDTAIRREQVEVERRERAYRAGRSPADPGGRVAIVVDDGLATGSTMRAAAHALRRRRPARVVIAVPVAARDVCDDLETEADEVVCGITPESFDAVGQWYVDFSQTSDDEVRRLLADAESIAPDPRSPVRPG